MKAIKIGAVLGICVALAMTLYAYGSVNKLVAIKNEQLDLAHERLERKDKTIKQLEATVTYYENERNK